MFLYRYEEVCFAAPLDEHDNPILGLSPNIKLYCYSYEVTRTTNCGFWLPGTKWVSNSSKKRFAHPTKDEAYRSFQKRKERQISILKAQLRHAELAHDITQKEAIDL